MLAHGNAADIIKIDNDKLRKVCADSLNASTASFAPLYRSLFFPLLLGSSGPWQVCQYVCFT